MAAYGTLLALGLGAVDHIFLQCALNAVLPSVDALILELQRSHQLDDVGDGHAVAKHAADELRIVPILGVELLAQALDGCLIPALVLKLEVVTVLPVLIGLLDNLALCHSLGQHNALLVVLKAGENLVRISIEQAHESHPFLLVVLETHHVALQLLGPNLGHFGLLAGRGVLRQRRPVGLLVFFRHGYHHARAASVAVDGATLAPRPPCFHIQAVDERLVDIGRKVDRDAYRVVHPLLYRALHTHLHEPVYVVGRSLVVRRLGHEVVYFLLRIFLLGVVAVDVHPCEELVMVHYVLLERVANLVDKVDMNVGIAGVHLAAALVYGHEHRFDAARCLRHEARSAGGGDGQAGYVAAPVLGHVLIQLRVGLAHPRNKGVVLFALGAVYLERAALAGHVDRRAVGGQGQRLVNLDREIRCLFRAVAKAHGGQHVALGRDAHARAAAHAALAHYLFPQVALGSFHLGALRVAVYLGHYHVNLLKLQVDDVVHYALCSAHVGPEQVVVETRVGRERVDDIRVKVDGQEPARVVRAQRYLAAGVGRDGAEAQVGIAVGQALTDDSVPEEHSRLSALPGVVHNLAPKVLGADFLSVLGRVAVDGELLHVRAVVDGGLHEVVVYLHRYIGPSHLAFGHLGVYERLAVRMLYAHRKHERTAPAVLRHLTGRVAVALHERHEACRGERRVVDGRALRAYVRHVVPHSAAPLHQLHLLLVDAHDGSVRVGIAVDAYHEAVAERGNLVIVAYAGHGTAGRYDVAEVVEQVEHLAGCHRVGILLLYPGNLIGYAPVHVFGRFLVDIAEAILHGILVHPHAGCQLVATEIFQGSGKRLLISECLS